MPEDNKNQSASSSAPKPEVLQPQSDEKKASSLSSSLTSPTTSLRPRGVTHRPSHKATFIGISIVVVILAINIAVIVYFMNTNQDSAGEESLKNEVTISAEVLNEVGVSRNSIGNSGVELSINPNTKFGGTVTIGGTVSVSGDANFNGNISSNDASFTNLKAGDTALETLNVNGDGTVSNLNLRNDLTVVGTTRLQGPVNLTQLLSVNNSANISGNLSVGGALAVQTFQASSLVSESTLTIGGHIITRGTVPSLVPGGSLGMNGTVSISGNDAAGTIAVNIGVGGGGGVLASVTFASRYSTTPHVVVSAATAGAGSVYATRSATGFTLGVNDPLALGTYVFDYIVMQ